MDISFVNRISIPDSDRDLLASLLTTWEQKRRRNLLRTMYYEGKQAFKNFGISIPPRLAAAAAPLMWVAKSVHAFADRSNFEGFVNGSGEGDPYGVAEIAADNEFEVEFPQATLSSTLHGCSFITVSHGDVLSGEPDVLMLPRAADMSGGIWDARRRAVAGFLSVTAFDGRGIPSELIMYTPFTVYSMTRSPGGRWSVDARANPLRRVGVAPLRLRPELGRPFGHSRITRSSMGYVDSAARTMMRAEAGAEFYGADSFWLFGADVTQFIGDDKWSALMGRIKALDIPDGEDKPDLHHISGASPQPHIDILRMFASEFASDQNLDVKFSDAANPSSADAIYAAKEDLIVDVRGANRGWGRGAVTGMQLAVMLKNNLASVPDELKSLSAQFTDPAIISPSGRADAFSKLAASIEGFAQSEVGLEYAGLSREQIVRFRAEQRRGNADSRLAALAEAVRAARDPGQPASRRADDGAGTQSEG